MAKHKKKKSDVLTQNLKSAFRYSKLATRPLECWRLNQTTKLEYTVEQKQDLHKASQLYRDAQAIVKKVYAEMIGKLVVEENT